MANTQGWGLYTEVGRVRLEKEHKRIELDTHKMMMISSKRFVDLWNDTA